MTFPTVVKKSGPTVSKTGSGSKTLSPGSPRSPLNTLAKLIPGSPVKVSPVGKTLEKNNNVGSPVATAANKPLVSTKSSISKLTNKPVIDAKSELTKKTPAIKKPVNKPPPLNLNIKITDVKELQSPVTPKLISKSPKTPVVKSSLPKSPLVNKTVSATKSSVLTGVVKSPSSPISKFSASSSVIKSTSGIKNSTTTSLPGKIRSTSISSTVSSPVTKSPQLSTVSKSSTTPKLSLSTASTISTKPIASKTIVKDSSMLLKSDSSKGQATIVKPTTPVKINKTVPTTKSVVGVKIPSPPTNKSIISKSPSTASTIKSISLKAPSKLPNKEIGVTKTSLSTKLTVNKSNVISKPAPISTKVIIKKESKTSSLLSVKSSSTTSTSTIPKVTTSKAKVTTSTISSLVPKSPTMVKSQSTCLIKTPTIKTIPSSPTIPLSPTIKSRNLSLSKVPLSPVLQKMKPTKLILSPGLTKSKSLSSSRLGSISTESLVSKTSVKSPISAKVIEVTKSPSKIKEVEKPKPKNIRGGQSSKKTIDVPGITELSSKFDFNEQRIQEIESRLESAALKEEVECTVALIPAKNDQCFGKIETDNIVNNININDNLNLINDFVNNEDTSSNLIINIPNISQSIDIQDNNLEIIEEHKQDEDFICKSLDFVVVKKEECLPHLISISQSADNCAIAFDNNHFETIKENVLQQLDETQSCSTDMDDHFETMNDKLVLGDVPFETDSSDISDNEHSPQIEINEIKNSDIQQTNCVDVFSFPEDLPISNFDRSNSTDDFIEQFVPELSKQSEDSSSISTDDGSLLSRKSYSEAVLGSPKDGEYYFDYDCNIIDDCLDYDDEEQSAVFVEISEKEFPELKPKSLSGKRRKNKKQKKRNYSRTETKSDYNTSNIVTDYHPEDFDGNEFCNYIKMMKDCSFYPNGIFSSDSVKLSTASWLDISVRTTDDDLTPSTEFLNTYEIFQASNLNKDFLMSIIGSTTNPTSETTWFWKSIEGKHQKHKANITLSFNPIPKHLTTPRFMTLLALVSEAKGYNIEPSLSQYFVTVDCFPRFDNKIRRLMVQGFWLVGRLIKESLSDDEEVNCGNPFEFVDGDIGFWWAGINMLDWQEYMEEEAGKSQPLPNCYQFIMDNVDQKKHNSSEALLSINEKKPEDFLSDLDVENFIHTVRNVKYYCDNYFVDSEENIEIQNEGDTCGEDSIEWEKNSSDEPN